MDYPLLMDGCHDLSRPREYFKLQPHYLNSSSKRGFRIVLGILVFARQILQGLPAYKRHRKKRVPVRIASKRVDRWDARELQAGSDLRLFDKTALHLKRIGKLGAQHFYRNGAT